MKIVQSIKKRKNDIQVTFEDGQTMDVIYDIYVKYHLMPSLNMTDEQYKEMHQENAFLFFKRLALKRLSRMMTAHELYTYLIDKGSSEGIAKQIVHDFKEKKYVNDDTYAKWYITSKQLIEGPRLMTDKLKQKGVDLNIIKTHLKLIDERLCLHQSIAKKLKGKNNQNKHQLMIKLKRYYMQKGFHLEVVNQVVKENVYALDIDETSLLQKDLDKLLRKTKVLDKQKLIEKLYRKGYRYDDIKTAIEEVEI